MGHVESHDIAGLVNVGSFVQPVTPRGPIVVEQAATGPAAPIPYEKSDRTPAGPLQHLEVFLARWLNINRQLLVSIGGQIAEYGSVALFARSADLASDEPPVGYYVASYDARTARFVVAARTEAETARRLLGQRAKELSS